MALKLVAEAIPIVIYSGVGVPPDLASVYPNLPLVLKPSAAVKAVTLLAACIAGESTISDHKH